MSDTLFVPPKRITDHLYTLNLRKLRISEGYTEVITAMLHKILERPKLPFPIRVRGM
jgi:hypothetical protein